MFSFFESISNLDKTAHNVSAVVISGKYCGEKALFKDHDYVYTSSALPLWESLRPFLEAIHAPQIIQADGCDVFCEALAGTPHMIICGAGHISLPIITMGKMLGFHITVIDDRPQFCNNARAARADAVICSSFDSALGSIAEDKNNYYVIVTRGHRYDITCLRAILDKPHTYIGMIGSRKRIAAVVDTLTGEGVDRDKLEQVHMPIGLNIKAETPEEIAVAIVAQIIQVKNEAYSAYCYSREMLKALTEPKPEYKSALVTILRRRGSAPRNAGTKMLVFETGEAVGTIGGGCAEAAVSSKALRCIKENRSEIVRVDMTGQDAEEDGMVCGGVIDVFIEPI